MDIGKIKVLSFRMGNPFCGIRKLHIDFEYDNPLIKHNGWKDESQVKYLKEDMLNDLKNISFDKWEEKYINHQDPNSEYYWSVYIKIEDKEYLYEGINKFPNDWNLLIKFIEKYTTFKFEKE